MSAWATSTSPLRSRTSGSSRACPSRIGYLLDIAPKELEKVLYFAASIVTWIDEEARAKDLGKLEKEVDKVLDAYEAREGGAHRRSCASRSSGASST